MVRALFEYKKPLQWFLFHVALGIASAVSPFPLIIYFYAFLFFSGSLLFKNQKFDLPLSYVIVYLTSFELLARMAGTSPFIPYELGKYLLMALLLLGIFRGSNKGVIGFILVLLLVPALFYDLSGYVTEKDIRFNLLGSFNIGLAIWYFYKQRFSEAGLKKILTLLALPLISVLAFSLIKTPDLDSIEFTLGANFDTTGGFGSNQVSTAFGIGMMIGFFMWLFRIPLTGIRWFDLMFVLLFTFQGLLSFSRGGMIGGFLGISIIIFYLIRISPSVSSLVLPTNAKKYFIPLLLFLALSFIVANNVTDGQLLLRYQGETAGTLAGSKEKTINTITTNRYEIFFSDIDLVSEYGLFGVGAGASKYLRNLDQGFLSHVEMSRLIAEHGVLGIMFCLFVLLVFVILIRSSNKNIYKGLLLAFLTVGWYTSFHAATRTYVTPLFMGLSVIAIVYDKNTLPRQ